MDNTLQNDHLIIYTLRLHAEIPTYFPTDIFVSFFFFLLDEGRACYRGIVDGVVKAFYCLRADDDSTRPCAYKYQ